MYILHFPLWIQFSASLFKFWDYTDCWCYNVETLIRCLELPRGNYCWCLLQIPCSVTFLSFRSVLSFLATAPKCSCSCKNSCPSSPSHLSLIPWPVIICNTVLAQLVVLDRHPPNRPCDCDSCSSVEYRPAAVDWSWEQIVFTLLLLLWSEIFIYVFKWTLLG